MGQLPGQPAGLRLVLRPQRRLRLHPAGQHLHALFRVQSTGQQRHLVHARSPGGPVDVERRRQLHPGWARQYHVLERRSVAFQAGRQLRRLRHAVHSAAAVSAAAVSLAARAFLERRLLLLHAGARTQLSHRSLRLGRLPGQPPGLRLVLRPKRRLRLHPARQHLHALVRLQPTGTERHLVHPGPAGHAGHAEGRRQLLAGWKGRI